MVWTGTSLTTEMVGMLRSAHAESWLSTYSRLGWKRSESRFPAVYQHVLDNVKPESENTTVRNFVAIFGGGLDVVTPICANFSKHFLAT